MGPGMGDHLEPPGAAGLKSDIDATRRRVDCVKSRAPQVAWKYGFHLRLSTYKQSKQH